MKRRSVRFIEISPLKFATKFNHERIRILPTLYKYIMKRLNIYAILSSISPNWYNHYIIVSYYWDNYFY
jgi:hypothetical protein